MSTSDTNPLTACVLWTTERKRRKCRKCGISNILMKKIFELFLQHNYLLTIISTGFPLDQFDVIALN